MSLVSGTYEEALDDDDDDEAVTCGVEVSAADVAVLEVLIPLISFFVPQPASTAQESTVTSARTRQTILFLVCIFSSVNIKIGFG